MPRRPLLAALAIVASALIACATTARADDADAEAGQKTFKTQCGICHSPVEGKNMVGPSLFGVFGRHASQAPNFHYSNANKNSNLTWDAPTLDKYLTSPREVVPGTIMTYAGLKDPKARANVIEYLKTLH